MLTRKQLKQHLGKPLALMVGLLLLPASPGMAQEHFNSQGNLASQHTIDRQAAVRAELAFEDERDFEEAQRGLIAEPDFSTITGSRGNTIWNMGAYDFLLNGQEYDSIHPSLQRIASLNMNWGLFEVIPDFLYQVRGFDLANMTLVMGETGWIIFDVLHSSETAVAALALANEHLGERPVRAVIYSHTHRDHFGGVLGVITEEQVANGEVQVFGPRGFVEEAIAERLFATGGGRGNLQYAGILPESPYGRVDSAIGKAVAVDTYGMIAPTVEVMEDYETHVIDGITMVFQNTPGTEAPAEMNTWFPDSKVFWAAENVTATIHNVYTLRGTLVRDALLWSKKINEVLYEYGQDAEVMVSSHNWPRWGNERIQEVLRAQRDAYANLHNQSLFLANQGVTINEVQNEYSVPLSLRKKWSARQYHGSEFHNSRAILNRYLGYWDGNPATLVPLSPADSAPLYVEMMGGASTIIARANNLYDAGDYRLAMEILNKLVYAEPTNREAKNLLASTYEQLGYQYESTSLRNVFLEATRQLRSDQPRRAGGVIAGGGPRMPPSVARSISAGQWLDLLGIHVDSQQADGMDFTINLDLPDIGEQYIVEMSHGTLTSVAGYSEANPELSISVNREDLSPVIAGQASLLQLLQRGVGSSQGDIGVLEQLGSVLVGFVPGFAVVPGTEF